MDSRLGASTAHERDVFTLNRDRRDLVRVYDFLYDILQSPVRRIDNAVIFVLPKHACVS